MEISNMESNPISVPNLCEWCGGAGTCRCGRCHVVYYCSKEHQMQHWAIHKKICKKSAPPLIPSVSNMSHNMSAVSNMSHIVPSNMSHIMPPASNMIHIMPSASNMSHIMSSASNMSHMPSASNMSHMPSTSNMSHNMPSASNMSHNMSLTSNMSHNMPSTSNMSHNMPSPSNMSHNMPPSANMSHMNVPSTTSNLTLSSVADWNQSNISTHINEDISRFPACGNVFDSNNSCIPSEKPMDLDTASVEDILSSISNDLLSSDNSFWNLIGTCNDQDVSDLEMYLNKDGMNEMSEPQNPSASNISNDSPPCLTNNDDDQNLIEGQPLSQICRDIIRDLNDYGICLFNKFLGSKRGNLILDEVKRMYTSGIFEKGKLVKSSAYIPSEVIRSDVMTWVNGTEPYCKNIGYLIQKLDLVIATCNKMKDNGQLSNYKLHRRTKAMVACYPGNRTHYKRHVDNPNKDGRCITCIYYLNKNWDSKIHGGLLRMFPSLHDEVAEIEPIFDRMIFFWSDRRNPHEVLPALATRFAITVWYFDADEREESLRKQQEKGEQPQ